MLNEITVITMYLEFQFHIIFMLHFVNGLSNIHPSPIDAASLPTKQAKMYFMCDKQV